MVVVASARMRGEGVPFERVRRITGYAVPNLKTWNSAKRAEQQDRVSHSVSA